MTRSEVPFDPFDLGHAFACVGLMECAAAAVPAGSERDTGRFVTDGTSPRFELCSPNGVTIGNLIDALRSAELVALRPAGTELADKRIATESFAGDERVFPAPPPDKPSALPVAIRTPSWSVRISSWAEDRRMRRDNAKFWAGHYTGASVLAAELEMIADADDGLAALHAEPFDFVRPLSSSLRLDWRRDYVPLDSGSSPNKHGHIEMMGRPLVELLAAIGLEHARPRRPDRSNKLRYEYALPHGELPLTLLRAAVGGADIGRGSRRFSVRLNWPGKEGQARCIDKVEEIA